MNIELRNFFVRCRCGYSMRFDFLEQTRTCICGAMVMLQPGTRSYLLAEHEERRKRLAERCAKNCRPVSKFVYRDSEGTLTIQAGQAMEQSTDESSVTMGPRHFTVTVQGASFRPDNVSKEFVDELQKFINEHSSKLWEL